MKSNFIKGAASGVEKVLSAFLRTDANSASCCIIYQPRAPKGLTKFKKKK